MIFICEIFVRVNAQFALKLSSILKWSRQESNLYLEFRKRSFYPLNYETNEKEERNIFCKDRFFQSYKPQQNNIFYSNKPSFFLKFLTLTAI